MLKLCYEYVKPCNCEKFVWKMIFSSYASMFRDEKKKKFSLKIWTLKPSSIYSIKICLKIEL